MLAKILAAAFLSCVSLAATAARPGSWTFIELNGPGASQTVPLAINNRGQVAGWFTSNGCYCDRAFLWDNGEMRALPLPEGARNVRARGINDHGTVVGHTVLDGTYAMMWKDGAWSQLGFMGEAVRINKSGSIAGTLRNAAGHPRGFLLRDGVLFEFGTFGGVQSNVTDLNERNQVVGTSDTRTGVWNSYLWDGGTMTNLGTLGGAYAFANSINDRGVVVGSSHGTDGIPHAFAWDGVMRQLLDVAGFSSATAINDRGAVVGLMNDGTGNPAAFLFDDGTLTRLKDIPAVKSAGWRTLLPTDINDRGWITGWGEAADGSYRGFVLAPR